MLFPFLFIIMWILFGGNTWNADYASYQYIYSLIGHSHAYVSTEPGFELLSLLAAKIGLNYNGFLIVYSLLGLILITTTLKKYTNKINLVLILYILYPFLLDIVQIRNFMAMCIILYSTKFLITNNKIDFYKYVIGVILATLFHNSAIFYLIFLLVKIKSKKKIMITTISVVLIGIIFQTIVPNIIYNFFPENRYDSYFSFNIGIMQKVLLLIYLLINLLITYYSYKRVNKLNSGNEELIDFSELVMKINILIMIVFVFLSININFIRLFRNILPLNYILYSNVFKKNTLSLKLSNFIHSLSLFIFIIVSNIIFIILIAYESVVIPIFTNNLLFK